MYVDALAPRRDCSRGEELRVKIACFFACFGVIVK